MIESKFRIWAILPPAISIVFIGAFIGIIYYDVPMFHADTPVFFIIFFPTFYIYTLLILIWGEIRTKTIKVCIENNYIAKKSFLGLGPETKYEFQNISGYKTSILYSKGGTFEYLYLLVNDKKIIKLSEFYHRNYKELKATLMNKSLENLGVEQSSLLRETKELFS